MRFLIIGLPRSGSTYLATLVHSHSDAYCAGEIFNPFAIVGLGWKETEPQKLVARDESPCTFLREFYEQHENRAAAVGAKFMIGHHPEILSMIEREKDIKIIYIHRDNKLAQSASWFKALKTRQWAAIDSSVVNHEVLQAWPRELARQARDFDFSDYIFQNWLGRLQNEVLDVEYCDMFTEDFESKLCAFLDLTLRDRLTSSLVKQGQDDILERFEHKREIERYFRSIGKSDWLNPEIKLN
ncbi:MAG: sulfotransferase [Erythrobacter sp.]